MDRRSQFHFELTILTGLIWAVVEFIVPSITGAVFPLIARVTGSEALLADIHWGIVYAKPLTTLKWSFGIALAVIFFGAYWTHRAVQRGLIPRARR